MPDDLHSLLVVSLTARLERARAEATKHTNWATACDPASEIRRVEVLLRVVERHAEARAALVDAERHRGSAQTRETMVRLARLRLLVLTEIIRDLAAGEGIEVGT